MPGPREAMKQVVEVQKKAMDVVIDSNAKIPNAGTQVEEETSKFLNTAKLQGTTQRILSEEIPSDWNKEAAKMLEEAAKETSEQERDRRV